MPSEAPHDARKIDAGADWGEAPAALTLPRNLDVLLAVHLPEERAVLRRLLLGLLPDAHLREVTSSVEAASLARREPPHVLILDDALADGEAADVLLRLTVARGTLLCPTVVLTDAGSEEVVRLLRLGAGDYLSKLELAQDAVRGALALERAIRRAREQHRLSRRAALYRANTLIKRRREREALDEAELARREAERARERLGLAVEGADLGTWDWYPATGRVVHNDRLLTMLGYGPDELTFTYTLLRQLLHPEDVSRTVEALGRHLEGQTPQYRLEYRLRTRDGHWKWVLVSGQVVARDELGRPTRVAGVHLDVDDRKRAETGLIEAKTHAETAQQQLVDMVTSIRDAFLLLDSEWRYTFVNPRAEELLAKSASELVGQVIWDVWPNLDDSAFAPALRRAMYEREMGEVTGEFQPLGRWFELRVYPAQDQGISLFFIDVTDARKAEAAVVESERRNRLLVEAARQLGSSLEPEAIYTRLRESVAAAMPCGGIVVSSYDAAEGLIRCAYAWVSGNKLDAASLPPLRYTPEAQGMQTQVILTGKPMLFDVARQVSDARGTYYEYDSKGEKRDLREGPPPKTRSAIMVPLFSESAVVGVVQVMSNTDDAYTQEDLAFLEGITLQLSAALENARLYRRAQEELEERRRAEEALREGGRREQFLSEATKVLTESLDPEAVFQRLAQMAVPMLGDFCFFDTVGEEGQIRRAAWSHVDPTKRELFRDIQRMPPPLEHPNHPVTAAITSRRPQLEPNATDEWMQQAAVSPQHLGLMRAIGFHSLMTVPLMYGAGALGAMTFGFDVSRERRHTPADLELAEELARRAAIAVRNAALYRQSLEREASLREAKHSAESARVSAERAKETAEQANRAKSEFLAVLSHELRTPLTPVLAGVQLLQKELEEAEAAANRAGDGELNETLAMIRRNVELEVRLIDDLLDLTRVTRGKMQLNKKRIDLNSSVRHVAEICRSELEEKGMELSLDLAADPAGVLADPARLQQVLWNLVKNAIKFTQRGGRVTVSTAYEGPKSAREHGHVMCKVADTGLGIDPKVLPGIFNAFEQGGENVTRTFGGLGLGLAISRALVVAHGGSITAASGGPGQGSTFAIRLPARSLARDAKDAPESPEGPSTEGVRVLLVEDHVDTARLMSRFLERRLRVQVLCAGTVAEGVAVFEREAEAKGIDLIISDIGLPDGTGRDLLRRIHRDAPNGTSVPAIALSGYGTEQDIRTSRDAGFREHITKPVDLDRLEQSVRRVLR